MQLDKSKIELIYKNDDRNEHCLTEVDIMSVPYKRPEIKRVFSEYICAVWGTLVGDFLIVLDQGHVVYSWNYCSNTNLN